jgi:glycosyltransferase involved in cell wall biosynthesis
MVTDGAQMPRLEKAIESVKDAVGEKVIIYQGTDEEKAAKLNLLSDFLFQTTPKGNADLDRNWAYSLASGEFILSLDDDEWVPPETCKYISRIVKSPVDVVWFKFKNLVDNIDIADILGDDPHPRLWRNRQGLISWPETAHTFPQINSPMQIFTKNEIVHDRDFQPMFERHEKRSKMMDGGNIDLEKRFIAAVKAKLGKK